MSFYAAFLVSTFLALFLTPLLIKYATVIGAVDIPNERKVHTGSIPRIGGIAMVLATIVPMLIWLPFEGPYLAVSAAILIIFLFGIWDDRKEISYKMKFAGQILAVSVAVFIGDIFIRDLSLPGGIQLAEPVLWILTIFFLVGITNAMNMTDGLDGLAGGATLLSFALIAVLSIQSSAPNVLLITVAVVGGILGFLRFNSHPAVVFMGDTGSQFLGLILGLESILLTQYADTSLSKSLPLLILGLPLIDTLLVMLLRMKQGRSPFHADKSHLHHRLLALGLSHSQAVTTLYVIQALFSLSAYMLAYSGDLLPFLVFVIFGLSIVILLWGLEEGYFKRIHFRFLRVSVDKLLALKNGVINTPVTAYFVPAILLFLLTCSVLIRDDVTLKLTPDVIGLSLGILVVSLASIFYRPHENLFRLIFAIYAALLVYLSIPTDFDDLHTGQRVFELLVLMTLVGWILLNIVGGAASEFQTSPFDMLIVLILLAMPFVVDVGAQVGFYALALAKFVVLLYAFEVLVSMGAIRARCIYQYFLSFSALAISVRFLVA